MNPACCSYQLEFVFSENPYFSDKSLVKVYKSKSEDQSEYLLAKGYVYTGWLGGLGMFM